MRIKVEKNILMPRQWPFDEMQVGDSFAVPPNAKRPAVNVAAMRYGRKHNMKFTVRKTPEGYRCWRIA